MDIGPELFWFYSAVFHTSLHFLDFTSNSQASPMERHMPSQPPITSSWGWAPLKLRQAAAWDSLSTGKRSPSVITLVQSYRNCKTWPISIFLSVCLYACMSVDRLSVRHSLCIYQSVHLSVCLSVSIYHSGNLSVCTSISPSVCLSVLHLLVYLSVHLSVHSTIYLSIYLSLCLFPSLSLCFFCFHLPFLWVQVWTSRGTSRLSRRTLQTWAPGECWSSWRRSRCMEGASSRTPWVKTSFLKQRKDEVIRATVK